MSGGGGGSYMVKKNRYDETGQFDDLVTGGQMALQQAGSGGVAALAQLNGGYLNPPMKLQTMLSTMRTNGRSLTAMYLWFGMQPDEKSVHNNLNYVTRLLQSQATCPIGYEHDDSATRHEAKALSRPLSLPASTIYKLIPSPPPP